MSTNTQNKKRTSSIESELYLLIAKFLSTGPCQESAKVIKEEIEKHQLLPKRVDWLGKEHSRSFNELDNLLSGIADDHLLKICARIGPILDKEIPPTVPGLTSLLGVGRQSFLRTKEDLQKPKHNPSNLIARKNGVPLLPSHTAQSTYPPNITQVLTSRELSGSLSCAHTFNAKIYARQQKYRRLLGHLSSVYCVLFDRTGKYIFTGADDLLVKIWNAVDGRLLATLRGHSAEITDMAVNYENTLLAAGSCDKTIRVWCLRTTAPVAVLNAHTGMVTSLQFCPYPKKEDHLLISTGNDGCVCFWQWNPRNNAFNPKPLKFTERNKPGAQMVCSSFSKGGLFLATGSTDHNVRVYNIAGSNGPEKILEREAHTDRVDSLQFSNSDCRFITGSKDGTASIWQFKKQAWSSIQLKMTTKLPGQSDEPEDSKVKLRVTMVGWTLDDSRVITAVSDYSIKIWDSNSGTLRFILKGHEDEVFVLEPHPIDPRVFLSSGHDGRIILWDLVTGTIIKNHFNLIEGQGHGAVFDCKFSPDGLTFASTDSHGHLSIFGFGAADRYKKVPEEQFFHTDYRPLIRDIHHHVLDEQTQTAPHLLPPPFLVDIDGNPYPPQLQRLVPGRENCNESQLVPYVAVSADGEAEILEPVRSANDPQPNRPTIDDMIERLQQEQAHHLEPRENAGEGGSERTPPDSPHSSNSSRRIQNENEVNGAPDPFSPRTPRSQAAHSRVGLRRTGDVEGVQSLGNWQSRGNQTDLPAWVKRVIVKPMKQSMSEAHLKARVGYAEHELNLYNQERKWRPPPEPSREIQDKNSPSLHWLKRPGLRAGTRARTQEDALNNAFGEEFENPENVESASNTETEQEEEKEASTDSTEDSDYSDWEIEENKKSGKKKKAERSETTEPEASTSGSSSRNTRVRRRRRVISDEDQDRERESEESEEESEETTDEREKRVQKSSKKSKSKVSHRGRKATVNGKKLPERFRPPEWLTDVMPHKAPYVPQIGDEIMYFRQGHELYVQAVKRNRAYDIYMRDQPWRKINIRDQEVAIIEDITFENRPPRLCCLKLALSNPASKQDESFVVKYHDMEDVIEFIILKQNYDQAMYYDWKPGDRFRSAIDKAWWLGTIKAQKPLNPRFPDSMFQCFLVKWDNGEREQMSPWDFERIDAERLPAEKGGSVDITPEERLAMMYISEPLEWSVFGRDQDCDRIARGLTRIMELSIAEPFKNPVDLNVYPTYAIVVEYPMDLGTIKARCQNRFYRRLAALRFDVQYIGINALKFNEPTSRIVKQAKCVVDLCLRFIGSSNCNDPMTFYQEMMEAKHSRSQDSQSELDVLCSESDSDGEHNAKIKRKKQNTLQTSKRMRIGNKKYTSSSWKEQCMALLDSMLQWDDSTPFRYPVNLNDYPNYRDIIDTPMDLSTVRERLNNNYYDSPTDLCKDMRLIFQNSRTYNINKKSRIYSMTIRLSAMFEEHIRGIVSDWKSAVKYEEKIRNNQYVSNRRKPLPVTEADVNVGPSTSRSFTASLPSSSRSDSHRTSMNRILNAAYSEPSSSRGKISNGIGTKKSKKHETQSSPAKPMVTTIKKKLLKRSNGNIMNGHSEKRSSVTGKQKFSGRPKRRTETNPKRGNSSFESSPSDSKATNHSNSSSESESDGSDWDPTLSKKRPKDHSESESSVFRSRSKRLRKDPVPHHQRTFRARVIKKHLRHTRATRSVFHRNASTLKLSVRSSSRRLASNPNSSRSITPEKVSKKVPMKLDKSPPFLRSKAKPTTSPPSKRAHLRRLTVQPRRYVNSGTTSDSDASASQSSKGDSTSNSPGTSNSSTKTTPVKIRTRNSAPVTESPNYSSATESEAALYVPSPRQTRNRGQRTVRYGEDSEDGEENYDSGNSQPMLSLSSRGRLRSSMLKKDKIQSLIRKTLLKNANKRNKPPIMDKSEESKLSCPDNFNSSDKILRGRKKLLSRHFAYSSLRSDDSNAPASSSHSSVSNDKLYKLQLKVCDNKKKMFGPRLASNTSLLNKKTYSRTVSPCAVLKKSKGRWFKHDTQQKPSASLSSSDDLSSKLPTRPRLRLRNNNETPRLRLRNNNNETSVNMDIPLSKIGENIQETANFERKRNSIKINLKSISNKAEIHDATKVIHSKKRKKLTKCKPSFPFDQKSSKDLSLNSDSISSHTRSANYKDESVSQGDAYTELSESRKAKFEDLGSSEMMEDAGSSNQSKENSKSAIVKQKWYKKKIRTAARISTRGAKKSISDHSPNKRETRYSGRRTVIYTEDIDSPYLIEMLEHGGNFESDSQTSSQPKEILTSSTNVPLSKHALAATNQRQSYVRCRVKHKPGNLKKYPLRTAEEKKPLKQLSNGIETRNRGERTMLYNDDSDFSDEFENLEPVLFNKKNCF